MKSSPVLQPLYQQLKSRELGLTPAAAWTSYMTDSYHFTARLAKFATLRLHNGCVNTISWSEDGRLLLSASDDQYLIISDPFDEANPIKHRISSGHEGNVFSARFLPETNASSIVSCGADGSVILTDVNRPDTYGTQVFRCHNGSSYEVAVIPGDSNTFLSCGDDGCVRWYDRREKTTCTLCRDDIIVECKCSTCSIDVDTTRPWSLAVGCSDSLVRLYDMRRLNKPSSGS
uniref:Uncharacterized protein n=1 Tax=Plectus sambesii TaxID=2011161 RepID=A0A914WAP7_9BILA